MKTPTPPSRKHLLALLALLSLWGPLWAPGMVLGNDGVNLEITPALTIRWWQWMFSLPSSVHPLSQKASDPTGANYCMVGQQGGEWFLGGVFKVVDISPASLQTQSEGNGGIMPVEIEGPVNTLGAFPVKTRNPRRLLAHPQAP